MTQIVIGVFDTPDTAYQVEETIMSQEGIDESCFHVTGQEGSQDQIRAFLNELFGPENPQMVDYYAGRISQGGALLSVDLPDGRAIEAIRQTMLDAGATDLNAKTSGQADAGQPESQAIPVFQEEMQVGKQEVETGAVRVSSRMEETPVREEVKLKEESASITRRPVDRPANPDELGAQGEKTFEVEEKAEIPVINKSARVVEEVEVGKQSREKTETVEDTVRRTQVDIEKKSAKDSSRQGGGK